MGTSHTARELVIAGGEALIEAAFRTGDFAEAWDLLEVARSRALNNDEPEVVAGASEGLGMVAHYQNITKLMGGCEVPDTTAAAEEELFRHALAIRQQLGDPAGTAWPLFGVGLVFQVLRGDWDTAMPYFWRALDLVDALEASGDLYGCSEIHRHVGFYFLVKDLRPDKAVRHLELSLDLRERLGDPRRIPSALVALGQAWLAAGHRAHAVELLGRAVREAKAAQLLPERIADAEHALRDAQVDR